MIQQLAVLNEEKELLKGLHQYNRHNFQDFQSFYTFKDLGYFADTLRRRAYASYPKGRVKTRR